MGRPILPRQRNRVKRKKHNTSNNKTVAFHRRRRFRVTAFLSSFRPLSVCVGLLCFLLTAFLTRANAEERPRPSLTRGPLRFLPRSSTNGGLSAHRSRIAWTARAQKTPENQQYSMGRPILPRQRNRVKRKKHNTSNNEIVLFHRRRSFRVTAFLSSFRPLSVCVGLLCFLSAVFLAWAAPKRDKVVFHPLLRLFRFLLAREKTRQPRGWRSGPCGSPQKTKKNVSRGGRSKIRPNLGIDLGFCPFFCGETTSRDV
ncbi:uncharacterized protein TM35_000381680 [Trypanosoma theileri]|uniref:Transmembrane protein n=1 Tax=Trypanosoma theileri TaxID=67003 RepID=A0A1X0NKW2_9TRYP|nr:uncharacterized protein TM35_000381680 [Trypanosoma theileri]ORC85093.1 hypothetical protein TM35_000381680 [Trypanosoma theileri]